MRRPLLRWLAVGTLVGLGIGTVIGVILARFIDLPAVESLMTFRPSASTQVRARDGSLLGSFASERRIPLPPEAIPKVFRDAVIAVEDANFYRHTGVDPQGILRAAIKNLLNQSRSQGASTITQQLARTLFLNRDKTFSRKFQEVLLAIQIEQRFSKDQIFTFYANQVNFGHGNYGVEAAARFYLGKPASALTLAEAALLAGLPQQPARLSPLDFPDRALARRNHVLDRMREERKIDVGTCTAAKQLPLQAEAHWDRNATAAYFLEEVRRSIEDRFGSKQMLEGGLQVETTLDPVLQASAEQAVKNGLVALQRRLGWPGARRNVLGAGGTGIDGFHEVAWPFIEWRKDDLVFALVTDVRTDAAALTIAGRQATLTPEAVKWTGRTSLLRLVKRGDVILVRLKAAAPRHDQPLQLELEPEPRIEGSLLALDNKTGAILALVGGFDFNRSQFDRAMQAKRQCGSAFKPFVFAAAFERGFSPSDTIFDGPVLLPDDKGLPTYCPINYYRTYFGIVTLRHAVEHSLNAAAVKLQQMVGSENVIDVAKRMGIREPLQPHPSMALGSFELAMPEVTAAYAGFANRGQVPEPYFISRVKDADGKDAFTARPRLHQGLSEDAAYLMTHVLEGVVQRGTAGKAADLPAHLAGKTGTTDRFTDAWFIGFSPRITCAVWVGRDMKEPIGNKMTGAEAALPTWITFMRSYLDGVGETVRQEEFTPPAGVEMVSVDRNTGLLAGPGCGDAAIQEAVPQGKLPLECSGHWHDVVALPWPQQLKFYAWKPGEPPTTAAAMAAAAQKLAEKE